MLDFLISLPLPQDQTNTNPEILLLWCLILLIFSGSNLRKYKSSFTSILAICEWSFALVILLSLYLSLIVLLWIVWLPREKHEKQNFGISDWILTFYIFSFSHFSQQPNRVIYSIILFWVFLYINSLGFHWWDISLIFENAGWFWIFETDCREPIGVTL